MSWETVIGLEIHAQLLTQSKIFSPAPAAFGDSPNTHVREVDWGLPGALPVLNRRAVEYAIKLGLAVGATINRRSEFARKNYFYPDLPKGYQISQFEYPIVEGGELRLPDGARIGITRAHLEEDAGKLTHNIFPHHSAVDLNRAGTTLLEIVSEPDMRNIEQAIAYATEMHRLVRWLGICDGNMQEGSYRVDANISVNRPGEPLGTRCEIKNLNSFRFLEQALAYEYARQVELLEGGGKVTQETRLYDTANNTTRSMRGKEEAHDYRYFPDPDLPPLVISEEWISAIKAEMPELPQARRARFAQAYQLSDYDAALLTADRALSDYYENILAALAGDDNAADAKTAKLCANWLCGDFAALLNEHKTTIAQCGITAAAFAELMRAISSGEISGKIAKTVLAEMWQTGDTAPAIIERKGLKQISDSGELDRIAGEIVAANPKQAEQYRAGKEKLFGFFVGQMMKATKGQANPEQASASIKKALAG